MYKIKLSVLFVVIVSVVSLAERTSPDGVKYLVFMRTPEEVFDQHYPYTINMAGFNEINNCFKGLPESNARLGIGFIFSYFKSDIEIVKQDLRRFLSLSSQTNIPVLIKLDGEQWWQNRPDLWNWWDPEMPGYDPKNAENVEWRWWGSEYALKVAWRNWGRQLRVLPPPNFMSPRYRAACHDAMKELLPIIKEWQTSLSEDKKDLFIGINLGWESSIGINSFYYPNGDDLLDQPERDDPTTGIVTDDVLSRGVVQIGYAAVKYAGLRESGDITEEDLYEVTRRHLEDLCKVAYEFGFPREKIFSHGVGFRSGEHLYDAALNPYSCPGWSSYHHSDNISKDKGITRGVKKTDAPYWAAVEWLLMKPFEKETWKTAFTNTLNYDNCRFLCVYNWEGIRDEQQVIEAVREIMTQNACGK